MTKFRFYRLAEEIVEDINNDPGQFVSYGLRRDPRADHLVVGGYAPDSDNWEERTPEDRNENDGTSAIGVKGHSEHETFGLEDRIEIEPVVKALELLDIYEGWNITLLGSDSVKTGWDRGEWVMRKAKIIAKYKS